MSANEKRTKRFGGKEDLSKKIGANLKRLIKEKGCTQEDFAERCYTDARQVRRWIANGVSSIATINYIAENLGVSAWALLA